MRYRILTPVALIFVIILVGSCSLFFPEVVITVRNNCEDTITSLFIHSADADDRPASISDNLLSGPLLSGQETTLVYARQIVDIEISFEHLNPIVIRDIDLNEMETYILTIN
jgi:hypothetical protein